MKPSPRQPCVFYPVVTAFFISQLWSLLFYLQGCPRYETNGVMVSIDAPQFLNVASTTTTPSNVSVSFIVPTRMRDTLSRTLESLQKQTHNDWEAIVGVDVQNIKTSKLELPPDNRIRPLLVVTPHENRGPLRNGAGEVRNIMIQTAAVGEWVAFVDDDDTVSPYYVEWLHDIVQQHKDADLVLFRMQSNRRVGKSMETLPRPGNKAIRAAVGISFAVRTPFFTSGKIKFQPDIAEDYNMLKTAQDSGLKLKIASCTAYFVKNSPQDEPDTCIVNNLEVVPSGKQN